MNHDDDAPISPAELAAALRNLPRCEGPLTEGADRIGMCGRVATASLYDHKLCQRCVYQCFEARWSRPDTKALS